MTKEARAIRALLPPLKLYPWAVPTIITLGILPSLSEGLGISLFIPFLQSLDQTIERSTPSTLTGLLNQFLVGIPLAQRRFAIPLLMKPGVPVMRSQLWLDW